MFFFIIRHTYPKKLHTYVQREINNVAFIEFFLFVDKNIKKTS